MTTLKKTMVAVAVLAISNALFLGSAFCQGLKIGYIDSGRILAASKDFAAAQEKLEKLRKDWEKEAAAKEEELKDLQAQFEKQKLLLSEVRREEMQRQIQAKYEEYRKFVDDILSPEEGKLAKKSRELMKPIYDKINGILQKIGEEEGYDFIFDAVPGGVAYTIVFAKPEYDLTDKVIEKLNKGSE
ncbi:MAG TPA: OmpH family outer membrane protein [Candidatus Latescibacteria bacterium]|nr:OmpH family outer membrane protein [Candidatus Latescibacterota bacterium]